MTWKKITFINPKISKDTKKEFSSEVTERIKEGSACAGCGAPFTAPRGGDTPTPFTYCMDCMDQTPSDYDYEEEEN